MISQEFIIQFYHHNKTGNAAQLWQALCVEYGQLSKRARLRGKAFPLAELAYRFITPIPHKITSKEVGKLVNNWMRNINARLHNLNLDKIENFLALLRLFLNCYPVYCSQFEPRLIEALHLVPYALPISFKHIEGFTHLAKTLSTKRPDTMSSTSFDLFNKMATKVFQADNSHDLKLLLTVLSEFANGCDIQPTEEIVKQQMLQIRFATSEENGFQSKVAMWYFLHWAKKISPTAKQALLNHIVGFQFINKSKIICEKLYLLKSYAEFFDEASRAIVVEYLIKYIHSSSTQVRLAVLFCATAYLTAIKALNQQQLFIEASLIATNPERPCEDALQILIACCPDIANQKQAIIVNCLLELLSNERTSRKAGEALLKISEFINEEQASIIINILSRGLTRGYDNFWKMNRSGHKSDAGIFLFELAKAIAHIVPHNRRETFAQLYLDALNQPHQHDESSAELEVAAMKFGGWLYSLSFLHSLIPDNKREQVQDALIHQATNSTRPQYLRLIKRNLEAMNLLVSPHRVDKAMLALLNTVNKLNWDKHLYDQNRIFEIIDQLYAYSSPDLQEYVVNTFIDWMVKDIEGFWFQRSTLISTCKTITAEYLKTCGDLTPRQIANKLTPPDTEDWERDSLSFMIAQLIGQADSFYSGKIQCLANEEERLNYTFSHLFSSISKMSAPNQHMLANLIIHRLPEEHFLLGLLNKENWPAELAELRPYMLDEQVQQFLDILITHLNSEIPDVFKYACYLLFELLNDLTAPSKEHIIDIIVKKLNHEDKDIKNFACLLMSHLLEHVPSAQHSHIIKCLLQNIDAPSDLRARNLIYSTLVHLAKQCSHELKDHILYECILRLARPIDRVITRYCILKLLPLLNDDRANHFLFSFLPYRIDFVKTSADMKLYALDLHFIMLQGTKERREGFEIQNNLVAQNIPLAVTDLIVPYFM